jgi:tryptophan synthase alpha chain
LGVTGAGTALDFAPLEAQLVTLRGLTQKPLAVGFGLSRAADVRAIAPLADGVIVGSALIDAYAGAEGEDAAVRVSEFVGPLIAATKR